MATKAIRGSRASIFCNGLNVSKYLNEYEYETESEELEFTPFESTEAEVVAGSRTTTLTLTGAWNGDDDSLDAELDEEFEAESQFVNTICPAGVLSAGKSVYLSPGSLINNNLSAASDEIAELEAEFNVKRSRGKILQGPTTVTATGNGTPLIVSALTTGGAAAHLHVLDVTGTPTSVAIEVEHSVDGTTWAPLLTFAPVTAGKTSERVETLPTATVNVQLRAKHTITGGTTPTVTYVLAVARGRTPS